MQRRRARLARRSAATLAALSALGAATFAAAADDIQILEVRVDRPTLNVLGVQVLIAGDDDRDATTAVSVRPTAGGDTRDAPALLRVWPETVTQSIEQQLAGSVFDLEPGTEYEIEIEVTDPDGGSTTQTIVAATRALPPTEPAAPNLVPVTDVASLTSALANAAPGDVIELADGTYAGSFFTLQASGTADQPIIVRGASQAGVVLDGEACTGCNVLEVYGSHVVIERMTIRNAERALRFQGDGATSNTARRLTIRDVVHGIGSRPDQTDFVIADNDVQGRLVWPWTFDDDATSHWDDRGIEVTGDGHVVAHNRIVGFGDPVVNKKPQARSWDVCGNDIREAYDGTELDDGQGNVRLYGNRFVDVMDPVSIQPVRGGPAYVLRNVAFNVPEEQIKLKSLGGTDEPSGVVIAHNTFVSPKIALNLQTPITQHNFIVRNNLFVGPETLAGSRAVEWTAALDGGSFDADGYYPDGGFWLGVVGGQNQVYGSFAEMQGAGAVEGAGVLLVRPIFEGDPVGPTDEQSTHEPPTLALATTSNAIDAGMTLVGVDGRAPGGPDLGAVESGCPAPVYGPRADGDEAHTNAIDCGADDGEGGSSAAVGSGGASASGTGSGNGTGSGAGDGSGGSSAAGNGSGTETAAGPGGASPGALASSGSGDAASGEDDGCGCVTAGAPRSTGVMALVAAVLVAAGAMRRSRKRASP